MPRTVVVNDSKSTHRLGVIDNEADFLQLQKSWNDLVFSNARYTIFSTWEWAYAWWQHYAATDCDLHIVTMEKGGELCAIAPFYKSRSNGIFGHLTLSLIGTGGEEWDEVTSVYLDLIVNDENESTFVEALAEKFAKDPDWKRIMLQDVLASSIALSKFAHEMQLRGCPSLVNEVHHTFPIKLSECFNTYLSNLSRSRRKSIKQNKNRFERAGKIAQRYLKPSDDIDAEMDAFVALHMIKQDLKGAESALSSNRFVNFHKQLLKLMLPKNWIDMRFVYLNDCQVSALYNFRFKNNIYSYQSGHNYEQWSPGLLADTLAIEEACTLGVECYDLLKGSPGSFKDSLGADQQELVTVVVYASKLDAYRTLLIQKIKLTVRKFRN